MQAVAIAMFCVWVASFAIFLSGDIAICDWEGGCGAGFPEWLFYATGWVAYASFAALVVVGFALLIRRIRGRS